MFPQDSFSDNFLAQNRFTFDHFEGSLEHLLCLVQKEELDLYTISLQELFVQFNSQARDAAGLIDHRVNFISGIAYLIWLKSKRLLPAEDSHEEIDLSLEDPHFEIIHHLVDYCRFKAVAKNLTDREIEQQSLFCRGVEPKEWKKPLGIEHVSLEDLESLFKEMLKRAPPAPVKIHEENWKVSDKIHFLEALLKKHQTYPFSDLFSSSQTKLEMIVIFLAVLEILKNGTAAIGREKLTGELLLFIKTEKSSIS